MGLEKEDVSAELAIMKDWELCGQEGVSKEERDAIDQRLGVTRVKKKKV